MVDKPPHGAPCNSCGQCCMDQPCPMAEFILGAGPGRCPALLPVLPGTYACGLVTAPERFAPHVVATHGRETASKAAAHLIGAGRGCDAQLDDEPANEEWRVKAMKARSETRAETKRAMGIWLT